MGFNFKSFNIWKSYDYLDHYHGSKSFKFYQKFAHKFHQKHKQAADDSKIELSLLGTFETGQGEDSAEIVAHDPSSQRLFITNSETKTVDILDISNPKTPVKISSIDVSTLNGTQTGGPNSVAVANGIVAVAIEADTVTDEGFIAFYD
ncbi:MAG: hypothetical protein JJ964_07305, partial [Rhizobiales bacterium]|nr:hypothetical protein [Hyphomicrobiales bacterium]